MKLLKYWFLEESFNMMKRVGMMNMMKLCEVLEMKTYKKGQRIHKQFEGDHLIYFIKKGHVKIGTEENDDFDLKYILRRGHIFGESRITTGEEGDPYTAIAMNDCTICFIETDRMEDMLVEYPKLNNSIFKLAGIKFKKIERRLDDIIYKDAETRIRDFIVDFVNENGEEKEKGLTVSNIFNHKDIAKLTSTSRQTVNNVISKLRKEGLLQYDTREIVLKQPA